MYFAIIADHRVKIKESKKMDEFLNLTRELKKLFNMRVLVVPIVIGVLETVPKSFKE